MPPFQLPNDPDEMMAIEASLLSLSPRPVRLDRDALMFRAGQVAPRPPRSRWPWPTIAAGLALIAGGEAVWLASRDEPRVVERLVVIHEPAPSPESDAASPAIDEDSEGLAPVVILHQAAPENRQGFRPWSSEPSYLQLRRQVLRFGLDAWPEPPPLAMSFAVEEPTPPRLWLRSEIDKFLNPGEPS